MTDMLVVNNLKKETIRSVIVDSILDDQFEFIFCRIGHIRDLFKGLSYDDIIDMNDLSSEN